MTHMQSSCFLSLRGITPECLQHHTVQQRLIQSLFPLLCDLVFELLQIVSVRRFTLQVEVNLQQGSPQSHTQGPEGPRLPSPTPNPTPLLLDPAGATLPTPHPAPAWPPTPTLYSPQTIPYFTVPDGLWCQDGNEFSNKTEAPVCSALSGGLVSHSRFGK